MTLRNKSVLEYTNVPDIAHIQDMIQAQRGSSVPFFAKTIPKKLLILSVNRQFSIQDVKDPSRTAAKYGGFFGISYGQTPGTCYNDFGFAVDKSEVKVYDVHRRTNVLFWRK